MNRLFNLSWLLAFTLAACTPETKSIEYGVDKCSHCRMSIVDQRFACQVVTTKSKSYSFDAVECMVQYLDLQTPDSPPVALVASNTLDKPGELHDATSLTYLVSENMPSPMGAYINPFADKATADQQRHSNGGTIYTWEELRHNFSME